MKLSITQAGLLGDYLSYFKRLIGDKRTETAFRGIAEGIINAGSLVYQRIAAHSSVLSVAKDGSQRVIWLVKGKSTRRSALDTKHLTDREVVRTWG